MKYCIGVTNLIEVSLYSLESQVIAYAEQKVLKNALQDIWAFHQWIDGVAAHGRE